MQLLPVLARELASGVGQLWVEESMRRGNIRLFKVRVDANPADALIKQFQGVVLDKHLTTMIHWTTSDRAD